jgi:adenosylcobinamide-GDP ribazoletransferase
MSEDEQYPEHDRKGLGNPLFSFITALQFLTISPSFIRRAFTSRELGQSTGFFPLVGLVLGGILLGANYLLAFFLPVQVRAALVLTLWVLLSGALHLDGFLDTCDGLLGGMTPEDRLRILRDERVGAFALAGGILLMLIKFTGLSALPAWSMALLLAPVLGRWGMTLAIVSFPYAREKGLGRDMKDRANWSQAVLATAIALFVAWLSGHWLGLIALVLAGGVTWGVATFTMRRIPGLTGDIYGAINELVEAAVLLTFVIGKG